MKSSVRPLLNTLGLIAALVVAIGMALRTGSIYFSHDEVGIDQFVRNFKLIQLGDSEANVLARLGKPDAKSDEFYLGQEKGFEDAYARARVSESKYYLVWRKGIDFVYCIGIDSNGTVRVKEYGGT